MKTGWVFSTRPLRVCSLYLFFVEVQLADRSVVPDDDEVRFLRGFSIWVEHCCVGEEVAVALTQGSNRSILVAASSC